MKGQNAGFCLFLVEEKKEKQQRDIAAAKSKVKQEIQELNEKLKQRKDAIQIFKQEIKRLADAHIEQEAAS